MSSDVKEFSNFAGCLSDDVVLRRTNGRCAHCGLMYNVEQHAHHMLLPERLHGGVSDECNIVMLCSDCLDRYIGRLFLNLSLEFPYMDKNEVIRSLHYIEDKLNQ